MWACHEPTIPFRFRIRHAVQTDFRRSLGTPRTGHTHGANTYGLVKTYGLVTVLQFGLPTSWSNPRDGQRPTRCDDMEIGRYSLLPGYSVFKDPGGL